MAADSTVFLAIQAALRLNGAVRKAYVDATRGRALILPLPRTHGVDAGSARTWFKLDAVGKEVAARHPRIQHLLGLDPLGAAESDELVQIYAVLYAENVPFDPADDKAVLAADGRGVVAESEMLALLEVRQWEHGEDGAPRTALQQVAGTIINLAVDYYAQTPGAVSEESAEGRLLLAFLRAIDDTDFADTPVNDLAGELLIAVLDSVSATPEVLGGGDKEQLLIENVTRSVANAARDTLGAVPESERRQVRSWLALVAQAMIEGGARTVLENPVRFFEIDDEAEGDLLSRVGAAISDLVLGDDRLTFQRLLSAEGLSTVVKAILSAVGDNPDLLKIGDQGLRNVLTAVAKELARVEGTLSSDLFPEVVRLLLEKSADNLDLIWGRRFSSPDRHLLVTASRSLLRTLAKKPPAGTRWKPRWTKEQSLAILDAVFDEVIDNPDWLIEQVGETSDQLEIAIEAMLTVLHDLDGDRFSAETGIAVLQAGVRAVAARLEFLDEIPADAQQPARRVLATILDAIFSLLFADGLEARARWRLARNTAVAAIVEIALAEIAKHPDLVAAIAILREVLGDFIAAPETFSPDVFQNALRVRLAA